MTELNPLQSPAPQPPQAPISPPVANITSASLFEKKPEKFGFLGLMLLILFGLTLFYAVQLYIEKNALANTNEDALGSISQITERIQKIQQKDNVSDQLAAKTILDQVEDTKVEWSDVLAQLDTFETEKVRFTNFSSNKKRQIFVTGQAETYAQVAEVVSAIQDASGTKEEFVESIVESRTAGGRRGVGASAASADFVQFQLIFTSFEVKGPQAAKTAQ